MKPKLLNDLRKLVERFLENGRASQTQRWYLGAFDCILEVRVRDAKKSEKVA